MRGFRAECYFMNIYGLVWQDCRWGPVPEQGSFDDFLGIGTQSSDHPLIPGGPPLLLYVDKREGSYSYDAIGLEKKLPRQTEINKGTSLTSRPLVSKPKVLPCYCSDRCALVTVGAIS